MKSMPIPNDLFDIMQFLYKKAEKLWWITFIIALSTPLLSIIAIWSENTVFLVIIASIATITPIAISWIRHFAAVIYAKADKCRRLVLYADGLGREIANDELASIRAWVIGKNIKKSKFIPPYYLSNKPVGPNRLADIISESAFFTAELSGKVIVSLWIVLLTSLLVVIGLLLSSNLLISTEEILRANMLSTISKSAAIIVAFLISGDFALLIKKYIDLQSVAKSAFDRCSKLRDESTLNTSQVFYVVEDYNVVLIQSPPIPSLVYNRYKDDLNKVYRSSHARE
jgi:hypothetical protein